VSKVLCWAVAIEAMVEYVVSTPAGLIQLSVSGCVVALSMTNVTLVLPLPDRSAGDCADGACATTGAAAKAIRRAIACR
jgi:hypothetical protein